VLVDESAQSVRITFTLDGPQGTVASPVHAQESILNAACESAPMYPSPVPAGCAGPAEPSSSAGW